MGEEGDTQERDRAEEWGMVGTAEWAAGQAIEFSSAAQCTGSGWDPAAIRGGHYGDVWGSDCRCC